MVVSVYCPMGIMLRRYVIFVVLLVERMLISLDVRMVDYEDFVIYVDLRAIDN